MISPLRGRILVEPISDYKLTTGGIWLATSKKDIPHCGKVLATGLPPIDKYGKEKSQIVQIGDIVHLKKYKWIKYRTKENKIVFFVKYDDILAVEKADKLYAVNDMILVKLEFEEKLGSFYVPDDRKQYRANFKGIVISAGQDDRLKEGDKIYILRVEDGSHEGFEVRTNKGKFWAIQKKWILGKEINNEDTDRGGIVSSLEG